MTQMQDLKARLMLDNAQFGRGLRDAQGQAKGFGSAVKAALLPVAAALAGAFSARALFQGIRQGAAQIDAVAKSARAVGSSVGGFRALELAAGEAGVPLESLRGDLQMLERQIAGGKADKGLRALGLSAASLSGLDSDQKLAVIADEVKALGLDAGQTMAVLQQFGIRNKDMALLVQGGGDAIRGARKDVADYGLALSAIDTGRIEKANDQIGRLSVIGQYLRDQLALAVNPALGELSHMFTESMRTGGLLRGAIDSLVAPLANLANLASDTASIFNSFAGWVRELTSGLSDLSGTWSSLQSSVSSALSPLTGALDVMASMVSWFADLIRATGGFGEALSALGSVAVEVWERIKLGGEGLGRAMSSVAALIQGSFQTAFGFILRKFAELTQKIAAGINDMFAKVGMNPGLVGMDGSAGAALEASGADELGVASRQGAAAATFFREATAPLKSVAALRDTVAAYRENKDAADGATESANRFNTALEALGGAGGGGGGGGKAGKAAQGIKDVTEAQKELEAQTKETEGAFRTAFVGVITGTKSLRSAIADLLGDLAKMLANRAFTALFSGGKSGGGIFSSIAGALFGNIGANANGTSNWRGGLTSINERGGEIVDLPRGTRIIPHDVSKAMMRNQQAAPISLTVYADPSVIIQHATGAALNVVQGAVPGMIGASIGQARERKVFR